MCTIANYVRHDVRTMRLARALGQFSGAPTWPPAPPLASKLLSYPLGGVFRTPGATNPTGLMMVNDAKVLIVADEPLVALP